MPTLSTTIRRGRVLAALVTPVAMALVLSAAGCTRTSGAAGAAIPAPVLGRLTAIARDAATANSDSAPEWITAVETTHSKALTVATPGDYVPDSADAKVFLITMCGHFTANGVSRPLGAKAPTGQYLSLILDARTFQELDFGLGPKSPSAALASLGHLTYLSGHRHTT